MTSKEAVFALSEYIGRLGGGETQEWEDIILRDLEVLDILKKSIFNKEHHKRVYEPVGEPFFMINISVKEEKDIDKVKGWVK